MYTAIYGLSASRDIQPRRVRLSTIARADIEDIAASTHLPSLGAQPSIFAWRLGLQCKTQACGYGIYYDLRGGQIALIQPVGRRP